MAIKSFRHKGLEDFFYEIFDNQKKAYRIYFSEL